MKLSLSLFQDVKSMNKRFEIVFLDEAFAFLRGLERKHYEKILYNIRKAQTEHDPELFKKLNNDIWEFRTLYQGIQYRLLAFWDKTSSSDTLVVSTHGFIKKQSKVPDTQVIRAIQLRTKYFNEK
ncbi:type II toxin-antitoxin system RelE/ParE family toxin [Olivibacter sitiensis]|uniref:type II toxin-antitoxin system RelE/ParE family toxin n=1 Tax=Olivibacter sitiensis TaxID=376470 RepID=UPI0003F88015|nr:type II toxin-antitoxin system RelE/ParE family toxin [Olivibacter sitiensis]